MHGIRGDMVARSPVILMKCSRWSAACFFVAFDHLVVYACLWGMMMTLVANLVIIEVVTINIIFDHIFEKNGKGDLFHVMHDHEDHDAYLLEVRVLPKVVAGERLPI